MLNNTFDPIRKVLGVVLAVALALTGLAVTAAPAYAATGGTIAVTVTLPGGGTPVDGVGCVSALFGSVVITDQVPSAEDCTPIAGVYTLAVPDDGVYRIEFLHFPGAVYAQFYPGVDASSTDPLFLVPVDGGATVPLSMQLVGAAYVSGTLTDGGVPVASDGYVSFYSASSTESGGGAYAEADGTYAAELWPADDYLVTFWADGILGDTREFWEDVVAEENATLVSLSESSSTVFDVDFATSTDGGQIDFSLTAPGGGVADDGCVELADSAGDWLYSDCAAAAGVYSFRVAAGESYFAKFVGFSEAANQWYGGVAVASTSTPIPVTLGETTSISATLIGAASMSGTVTLPGGVPAVGTSLSVGFWGPGDTTRPDGGAPEWAVLESDGTYSIDTLLPGTYKVHFGAPVGAFEEWYSNQRLQEDADVITLVAGSSATIGAELELIGDISGTVTDGVSPVSGATVTVYDSTGEVACLSTTDSNGEYNCLYLRNGNYYVEVSRSPGHSDTWYDGASSLAEATPIAVLGPNVVVDVTLQPGGTISGTVTDGVSPIPGGWVSLFDDQWKFLAYSYTDDQGMYVFPGLADGAYVVMFQAFDGFAPEWYDDASSFDTATRVTVSGPGAVIANAVLSEPASISGTVTLPDGSPAGSGSVYLRDAANERVAAAWTSDGTYSLEDLRPGTYFLEFRGFVGGMNSWYDGALDFASATAVTVAAGGALTIDQQLPDDATISCAVTVAGATGVASGEVELYDSAGELLYREGADYTNGATYAFTSLAPGEYYLHFTSFDWGGLDEWYGGGLSLETTTPITLTLGQDVVINQELDQGPTISGRVTASDTGEGIPYAIVGLNDSGGYFDHHHAGITQADALGNWAISTTDLPNLDYTLRFAEDAAAYAHPWGDSACGVTYACAYWGGGTSAETAVWFPVTPGASITGMDMVLSPGGSLSGTVTGASDPAGLGDVTVTAWLVSDPAFSVEATSDAAGEYAISGLPAGNYKVAYSDGCSWGENSCFPEPGRGYANAFWNGKSDATLADSVAVGVGAEVTGIDAVLIGGATLSGRVVDADNPSVGVSGAEVQLTDLSGGYFAYFRGYSTEAPVGSYAAYTDADGYYTVDLPLGVGNYKVQFVATDYSESSDYASVWWGGASFVEDAAVLSVTDTSPVTANGEMHRGGSIAGTVTRDGIAPVEWSGGAVPTAYLYNSATAQWEPVGEGWSDYVTGAYTIPGLNAGNYRVGFHDYVSNTGYIPAAWRAGTSTVFYDGVATIADGTDVVVVPGGTALGIDGLLTSVEPPARAAVSSLSPPFGTVLGGTVVTLTGENFTGATSVTFGGVAGTALSVAADTSLTVTAPAHGEVSVDVVVTTASGASSPVEFAYVDLTTSGVIYGSVTGPGGVPAGAGTGSIGEYWFPAGSDWEIGAAGTFATAVQPGDYRVGFIDFVNLANASYDDGSGTAYSDLVRVGVGEAFDASTELAIGGSIAGTVTGPGSVPAGGGSIAVHDAAGKVEAYGNTESDGTFSISGLGVGNHYLLFYDFPGLAWSWSGGATSLASAAPVAVSASATTPYDMELGLGETIAGTVTGPEGATAAGGYANIFTHDGFYIGEASADANGDYVTPPLVPGDYSLVFLSFPDLAFEWSGGASSMDGAAPVTVVDGASTTYDIQLPYTGDIAGTVSGPGGLSVGDGFVDVYSADGLRVDWGFGQTNRTWSGGDYGSIGLAADESYFVHARGFEGMADEWYEDSSSFATASPVTFGAGATTTADMVLAPPLPSPAITGVSPTSGPMAGGTAVTLTGSAFTGATSVVFGGEAGTSVSVLSDTQITVTTPAHAAGPVSVIVTTPGGASFAAEFTYVAVPTVSSLSPSQGTELGGTVVTLTGTRLTGASSVTFGGVEGTALSVASDTSLTVTAPVHAPGVVDVVVTTSEGTSAAEAFTYVPSDTLGTISGRVTGPGGTDPGVGTLGWSFADGGAGDYVDVAADGTFSFSVVPGESYKISFYEFAGLANETYDNAPSSAPTLVPVAAGEHVVINAELAQAGMISGTVTNAGGSPLSGGLAFAETTSGDFVGWFDTVADGTYVIANLAAGDYRVGFSHFAGYGAQWYSGVSSMSAATPVTVVAGANLSGVNAVLGAEAFITGTVAVPADFVGTDACVGVYDAGGAFVNGICYNVGDPFSIGGLGAGTYKIRVINDDGSVVHGPGGWDAYVGTDAWYANADTFAAATGVTVSAGESAVIDLRWDDPAISGISPDTGAAAGGTTVTLTGSAFTGATGVTFGGSAGTSLSVTNDGQLTVVSPAHAAGPVDVVVTTIYGSSAARTFTYVGAPAVSNVSPSSGPTAGGTTVTLTGSAFTGATSVTFGGLAGSSLTVANDGELTVVSPPHVAGAVNVIVTTPYGSSVAATFTYVAAPAVSNVSPSSGSTAGGTTVTLTGSAFTGATGVTFDGVAGTALSASSGTSLTVVSPAHAAGPVDVVVTTPYGSSVAATFTYIPAPAISDVSPATGPITGGTTVTLTGTYFTGATSVTFGGVEGNSLSVGSDSSLTVVSPAHAAGSVNVIVTSPVGSSSASTFTYVAAPSVSNVAPATGPTAGGTTVTLTGSAFTGATGVTFDGVAGTSLSVGSGTSLTVVSPSHVAGAVDVVVTTAYGSSSARTFTYVAAPAVSNVSPVSGPTAGGTTVTLTGSGFTGATSVTFGGVAGTALSVGSGTSLTVVAPAHAAGAVDVVVTTPYGSSPAATFTYVAAPAITNVSPLSGPTAGGTTVTLTGSAFTGATSVTFGGVAGTSLSVGSATSLTVVAPAHAAGPVNVVVTTPYGSSPAATFTYVAAPAVSNVSPSSGPTAGGTTVTLTGSAFTGATGVTFDGVAGTSLSVGSGTSLTVVSPSHVAGAVDVVVTTAYGSSSARTFTYVAAPAVSNVSPSTGSTAGGTTVTLTGSAFTGATGVTFDGVAGTSLSVGSATSLTIVSPTHAAGAVNVIVTTPYGSSSAATFTYVAAPAVSNVSPVSGPTAGGTTVTLTGSAFTGATGVTFDGVAGTSLSVGSGTSLTVVSPAHAAGAVDVVVTTAYGSSPGATFTYVAAPAVSNVSPSSGPTAGGTTVTLTGSAFTGATSVTFGGVGGTSLSVGSSSSLTVVAPAHAAGAVDVVVTTPYGSSPAATFTYVAAPSITNVSPSSGPTAGGTTVTLTGSAFTGATGVTFDGVAGTSLSVGSASSLTVVAPAHAAGPVDVVVTTAGGSSIANTYTYVAAPAVSNVSPSSGSTAGGTTVTLTGSAFTGATSVTFDGVGGTSLSVSSGTQLTVVAPAHGAGPVDVVVTTPYGSSVAATFTYVAPLAVPVVSDVSPVSGPTAGGTTVTLTGTGLTGATSVTFGGVAGTSLSVGSDSSLTVVAPPHAAGPVSVVVTTPGGSSSAATFTYVAAPAVPTVALVSPGFGPTAGGTSVTISGSHFTGATSVTFGGASGTGLVVVDDAHLTVTTPAGSSAQAAVVVTNASGGSPAAAPAFFAFLDTSVVAESPVRILDASSFTSGVVRCYPVVGLATVPDGATAVLLNVTAVGPSGNGYVVIYPDTAGNGATPAPLSSTVNFEPGKDVANSAIVALPSDGKVCAYSAGGTLSRLILDVAGYIVPGSGITIQSAQRLLDTRQAAQQVTGPVPPMTVQNVQVTGNAGVPAGARAVVANITVVGPTAEGHLRVWAQGTTVPNTSVVNYAPGQTKANGQIIALSPTGGLSFESFTGPGTSTNPVQVIIDVVGYVAAGAQFTATAPTRIVETRAQYGLVGPIPGALVPNTVYPVTLSDTTLIPSTATAVVLNVTAVGPTAFGNLRVYPDTNGLGTTAPPLASVINYIPGRAIPNMVIVQIPADRKINFYNNQGSPSSRTHLIVDVIGYINAPSG